MYRAVSILVLSAGLWLTAGPLHAQAPFADPFPPELEFHFPSEPRRDARPAAGPPRRISRAGQSAAGETDGTTARRPAPLWRAVGPLVLIVVLILVAARFWRKHGPRIAGGLPGEALEVLGKRHLDPRQAIHLVRIGSRILVLGSSAAGLRTLAEITDPVEVDYLAGLCRRTDGEPGAAQNFLGLFQKSGPAPADDERPGTPPARPAGEQRFAERLKQLSALHTPPQAEDEHAA